MLVMKKYLVNVGLTLFSVGLLSGCASQSQTSSANSQQVSLTDNLKLDLNEAISIYQKKYPKTDITSIELEKSLNRRIYRIEGVDDHSEYQININTSNQEIIHQRSDKLDADEQNGEKRTDRINLDDLMGIKKIARIAENQVKNGKATEFSLEQDMGVTYWEVNVERGSVEKEIKIDAQTGKVLKIESD